VDSLTIQEDHPPSLSKGGGKKKGRVSFDERGGADLEGAGPVRGRKGKGADIFLRQKIRGEGELLSWGGKKSSRRAGTRRSVGFI